MILKNKLYSEVKSLPLGERAKLADYIFSTFDQPDEKVDRAWIRECKSRFKAVKSGKLKLIPMERVLGKYK